jgi:hypothetical protein
MHQVVLAIPSSFVHMHFFCLHYTWFSVFSVNHLGQQPPPMHAFCVQGNEYLANISIKEGWRDDAESGKTTGWTTDWSNGNNNGEHNLINIIAL